MNAFGTPESIGEANKKLILNRLRTLGNMSKADLSRSIGMSFTAIASNVKHLLDHDYIREEGAGGNSLGRKSTLLSFNARRGYVVGVDVGRTKIRCMAADLRGDTIAEDAAGYKAGGNGERMLRAVCGAIENIVAKSGVEAGRILCVCVGIPGVVRDGVIRLAPNFANFSVDELRTALKDAHGAEVLVENGVKLGAIGEHRYGGGREYADMAYVSCGVGLGAALILDGRLYAGCDNAAGEIGFMQTRPDSERPRFEETGELERAVSGGASPRETANLLRDYRDGEKHAVAVLETVAANLGMAFVNICAVANPRAVILSGGVGKGVGGIFLDRWRAHLARHLPFPPELFLSCLDDRETMLGAVGTAVEYVETIPIATA